MKEPLITQRLLLEPWISQDRWELAADLNRMWMQPGVRQQVWDDFAITEERAAEKVQEFAGSFWTICEKGRKGAPAIGFCGIRDGSELVFALGPDHWKADFAKEAIEAVAIAYWASFPHERRLLTGAETDDSRSITVLKQVGMVFDREENGVQYFALARPRELAA